ncbi:hypothetical protein CUJ84_Chr002479 [Rhizobium leguminosarum]|uniref:Uncharacterized protein n=1 Tax=Rhizobium leguminosarum TaxID=384 RepID=A0A2K9Z3J7_RHILE|nr:hypothetical protein CUJ84_Chr002479 [Rhizobium leguminosarum]
MSLNVFLLISLEKFLAHFRDLIQQMRAAYLVGNLLCRQKRDFLLSIFRDSILLLARQTSFHSYLRH